MSPMAKRLAEQRNIRLQGKQNLSVFDFYILIGNCFFVLPTSESADTAYFSFKRVVEKIKLALVCYYHMNQINTNGFLQLGFFANRQNRCFGVLISVK